MEPNQQNKQANRTRDIETKNKLTGTRGEGREIMGKKGEGSSGNMYRGHMDKAKGGRIEGERQGWVVWGGMVG